MKGLIFKSLAMIPNLPIAFALDVVGGTFNALFDIQPSSASETIAIYCIAARASDAQHENPLLSRRYCILSNVDSKVKSE
jgi:hypothetical protein